LRLVRLGLVSFGFLGCAPWAPGTFGTLGGVAIAWALSRSPLYPLWVLVVAAALYLLGRSLGAWAERHAGGKDPSFFVLDEVIGYLLTVFWLRGPSLLALVVAFLAFRFFDILKPPPVRRMERVPGADGILLDDVVAGLYGLLVVMLPARLLLDLPWEVLPTS
jgi:phosphatidylglycerophosphatase A